MGEPAYRGRQIFAALHQRRLLTFDEMTDLPKDLRAKLNEHATAATLALESRYLSEDGTRRYLMKTHDNLPVETVFIPEERRDTICFSSQSGCPLQCTFCLTAQLGPAAFFDGRRDCGTDHLRAQRRLRCRRQDSARRESCRHGRGRAFPRLRGVAESSPHHGRSARTAHCPNRVTVSTAGHCPAHTRTGDDSRSAASGDLAGGADRRVAR